MREQRHSGLSWLLFIILSILILGGAWLYTNWQSSRKVLPPGLTINTVPMGGMTREQAIDAIALAYTVPITVYYGNKVTILLPEMVELTLDQTTTENNLDAVLQEQANVQNFVDYALDQFLNRAPLTFEVYAIVNYSRVRVDAFLERMVQKYDHPPQKAVALPEAGTFRPARRGTKLDIAASRPLLIAAILSAVAETRAVDLVIATEPALESSIDLLREALLATLSDFSGVAGVFVKHLDGGGELCLNCDVAFSGLSTLKIAIVIELYRILNTAPDAQTTNLIGAALIESDNTAANALLTQIGAGDSARGIMQVTELLHNLDLRNTFLAAPYATLEGHAPPAESSPLAIITPANSRADVATDPNPYIQTTPVEIALLLEGVYQCTQGGGFLRLLYPRAITPAECQDILKVLAENDTRALLREAMPDTARVAHQHGWEGATHADVALVYGPVGDFVITLFLYQPEWLTWEENAPTFAAIGSLSYRFFNGDE